MLQMTLLAEPMGLARPRASHWLDTQFTLLSCLDFSIPRIHVRRPSTAALMQAELSLHALRPQVHHQYQIRRHEKCPGRILIVVELRGQGY